MARPLVLVIGGGFAGVEAARVLIRSRRVEVLLVDPVNFALFTPMLPEVATGDIETRHILVPHRDVLPPTAFRQGRVLSIDHAARTAVVETRLMPRQDRIPYDHVLFSCGSVTHFFGVPGAQERALTFKTIGDAIALRNRLLGLFERATVEGSREGRERLCRVIIVGAGYSGVELAASLADFFRRARRQYPDLERFLNVTVVEALDRVTPMLPDRLQEVCRKRLLRSGVDLRLSTRVEAVEEDGVRLAGGDFLPSLTVVWSAGVKPSPDLARWGLPLDGKGRVRVDRTLRVQGIETAWAAGDAAAVPTADGGLAPPTAQHAMREGQEAGRNILAVLEGKTPAPYAYRAMGELVSLGHRSGAGVVFGVIVHGFIAWWLWRTYYLFRLPTGLRRVRVALDWTVDLFFQKDVAEIPQGSERRRMEAARRPAEPNAATPGGAETALSPESPEAPRPRVPVPPA